MGNLYWEDRGSAQLGQFHLCCSLGFENCNINKKKKMQPLPLRLPEPLGCRMFNGDVTGCLRTHIPSEWGQYKREKPRAWTTRAFRPETHSAQRGEWRKRRHHQVKSIPQNLHRVRGNNHGAVCQEWGTPRLTGTQCLHSWSRS